MPRLAELLPQSVACLLCPIALCVDLGQLLLGVQQESYGLAKICIVCLVDAPGAARTRWSPDSPPYLLVDTMLNPQELCSLPASGRECYLANNAAHAQNHQLGVNLPKRCK